MPKVLLALVLFSLALIAVWPLLAQNPRPTPTASPAHAPPHAETSPNPAREDLGEEAVSAIDADLTRAVEDLAHRIDHEGTRTVLQKILPLLQVEVFGFTVGQLLLSFTILLAGLLFRNVLALFVLNRVVRWAEHSKTIDERVVHALIKPLSFFLLLLAVYFALLLLPLSPGVFSLAGNLFRGLTMLTVVWGLYMLTEVLADHLEKRFTSQRASVLSGFAPLIKKSLKIFVVVIGVLMTIDNLGYNVTGILATLGLGTAAVALASQDTIRNAFGALMIALDRPFRVGDWIQVGDKVDGTVEAIGLRSTKVRTFPKTVVSIPNGVLANEYINNWSEMPKRRVRQVVGITYEATAEDMEGLVEDIRGLLREDEGVHQEFILVNFTDFGDSSLDVLVYYFTTTTVWLEHMDIRQRINGKIMRAIQARGLSIAFPTRSLYLDGPVAHKLAEMPFASRWDLPRDFGGDSSQLPS